MNKIWLIVQREFSVRVQKKSFLVATILVPLIFPAIIAVLIYLAIEQKQTAEKDTIEVLDQSGKLALTDTKQFTFVTLTGDADQAKKVFQESNHLGLLIVPANVLTDQGGIRLYSKENPSVTKLQSIERLLEDRIHDLKLEAIHIDKETLASLKTEVEIASINLSETGQEKTSNTRIFYGLGFSLGVLIYIFIFVYGSQTMQGVIDEKTSKIVEVIVSSVRPFQLMMGKILGIASVGLVQFLIWILLIGVVTPLVLGMFGLEMPQDQMMSEVGKTMGDSEAAQLASRGSGITRFLASMSELPFGYIAFVFVFYFIGGYLLYGALFAAVGASVDSLQESQQFMFPITIPLLIAYFGLFIFILDDPHGPVSFWFSVIPFTSPIAMVGRLGFGVPNWQLALSMGLLVGGFIFTTWIAGRIYRVGILMSGAKVNYKVLAKWFMMKA
jgi:ABC-2 type transport system permease protein